MKEDQKIYEFLKYVYFVENIAQNTETDTSSNYTAGAKDMFDELSKKLRKSNPALADKLSRYVDKLLD